jgi:leader peptidase (prepilin peptidase) / N-methyltransferase
VIWLALALAGLSGLAIGSFLNVVIHRVPLGQSVVSPRSYCPQCAEQLSWRENLPIVSWIWLRGRCRNCASRISVRYPAVELITAALFISVVAVSFASLETAQSPVAAVELAMALVFFSTTLALAAIDLEHFRLPTGVITIGLAVTLSLQLTVSLLQQNFAQLLFALIGAAAAFALLLAIHLIAPAGMGRGDANLMALLGLYLGWFGLEYVGVALMLGFGFGAIFGVSLVLSKRASLKSRIPFGPWLILGAWASLPTAEHLWAWYLRLSGIVA